MRRLDRAVRSLFEEMPPIFVSNGWAREYKVAPRPSSWQHQFLQGQETDRILFSYSVKFNSRYELK